MSSIKPIQLVSTLGVTGVALGAFGAHALRERLIIAGTVEIWEKAVLYHLVHAVASLAVVAWASLSAGERARKLERVAALWFAGIVFFSGSLYGLALGAPRWVGLITPLGGVALLVGWVLIALIGKSPGASKTE